MIDPVAAVLAWLAQDDDLRALIGDRLASKHKFGLPETDADRWDAGQQALTISPTPGSNPQFSAGMIKVSLEGRGWGGSQEDAQAVVLRLNALLVDFVRTTVVLPNGETALIYWIVTSDSMAADQDADVRIDFCRLPLRASVADQPVA